jgi:NAD(P)-dependent dehydrogenase (short-subunit alcohol dehydrogenase family)
MPTLFITGASRGLGLEFTRRYAADGWQVIAACRDPDGASELRALGVEVVALDMTALDNVADAAALVGDRPLDLVIANAGTYGPSDLTNREAGAEFERVLTVNTVAPTLLALALASHVERAGGKMIAISSQMGSIADNSIGGSTAYRASKAGLNAAWRSLSVDFKGRDLTMAMLHPGWVRTDMGGPDASISVEESIAGMREVIGGLTRDQSGSFFNYDGKRLPW